MSQEERERKLGLPSLILPIADLMSETQSRFPGPIVLAPSWEVPREAMTVSYPPPQVGSSGEEVLWVVFEPEVQVNFGEPLF